MLKNKKIAKRELGPFTPYLKILDYFALVSRDQNNQSNSCCNSEIRNKSYPFQQSKSSG